ncbi:conserved hypothetical protein [Gluconacetobacter diazotrophicus PA1 5]|uniref:Uncharacterized protein n=2 Tax=Gluconacetobacter diazotrophicus TaxID=33996 RepID=A9HB64_GLUDA|nr:hypothetical protein [Gluconacetobacter diazotrophicus]ACI50971.1 conserved hypothetical protein [Gluconacetobacter diazotrophicus PA1 5]MBB2156670.1 hypothetical protein [Gluconacetobacter diazotrophicus]TWB08574.1 hypothetical protein FBZ86_10671 [Gluconacetobacter diazotrophicus]CAP54772.1 conserved hypothetical protein [Gluconacetobacter diazotrophicus PA1 5]
MTSVVRSLLPAIILCVPCWGVPGAARAAPEAIAVDGVRPVQVADYRDLAKVFRTFNAFPAADRADLTLHLIARVLPGDRPIQSAPPYLRRASGPVALFGATGAEMHLPLTDALWAENPPVYAPLAHGQTVGLRFVITVTHGQTDRFTDVQARTWLRELDGCIEDVVGVVFAFLMPDAHKLTVEVAAGARLDAVSNGAVRPLVVNRGAVPYAFTFRPQDYPRDTVFRSDRPLGTLTAVIPMNIHGELTRNGD